MGRMRRMGPMGPMGPMGRMGPMVGVLPLRVKQGNNPGRGRHLLFVFNIRLRIYFVNHAWSHSTTNGNTRGPARLPKKEETI